MTGRNAASCGAVTKIPKVRNDGTVGIKGTPAVKGHCQRDNTRGRNRRDDRSRSLVSARRGQYQESDALRRQIQGEIIADKANIRQSRNRIRAGLLPDLRRTVMREVPDVEARRGIARKVFTDDHNS